MTRTVVKEARALLAVWDDPTTDAEDVVAAMERVRAAVDPLNADLIHAVEVDAEHRYLMCVWVKRDADWLEVQGIKKGMVDLAAQIEQGRMQIQPALLGHAVERIELVGFDVAASAGAEVADADASVVPESEAAG